MPYVSRGGLKTREGTKCFFAINVQGKNNARYWFLHRWFLPMSLYKNGARLSYALDVGYNQLAWKNSAR